MSERAQHSDRTLVIGIGSPHGDDRAGWLVAERLQQIEHSPFDIQIAKSPIDILDWLDGVSRLVICDTCRGLGAIGKSHRWIWPASEIATSAMSGTHNLALPSVLTLAEKLGRLPDEVVVWAIEGANHKTSTEMSYKVATAIPQLASRIAVALDNTSSTVLADECMNNR